MGAEKRKSAAPFYAVGVLWICWGALLPLYHPAHYAAAAAVSAVVFFLVSMLCRAGAVGQTGQAKEAQPKEESTGNPELDKMLRDGRLAIAEMKRLDQVSAKIFEEVGRSPEKLPQIRRFMDYYLPTTLKLLNAYDRMSGTGVSGENIDATLARVEGMMRTIVSAFEKQLDSLYGTEALDISTDITVLETMMAREGLTDRPLKADEPKEGTARPEL